MSVFFASDLGWSDIKYALPQIRAMPTMGYILQRFPTKQANDELQDGGVRIP